VDELLKEPLEDALPVGMIAPSFSVYARDEYQRTAHLTPEQFAAHWRALLWSWTEGPLPLNDTQRRQVCKVEGARAFRVIWGGIAPLWSIGPDGWRHEPLEEKRSTSSAFYKAQHDKAVLGGQARARAFTGAQTKPAGLPSGVVPGDPDAPPERQPAAAPEPRPIAALSSSSSDQDQELKKERADTKVPSGSRPTSSLAEKVGDAMLVSLALDVLADLDLIPDGHEFITNPAAGAVHVLTGLKLAAVAYNVSGVTDAALEAAIFTATRQRSSEAPSEAALRVARQILQPAEGFITRDEFNSRAWKTIERLWPAGRFTNWRGMVSALMYRDEWIRSLPHVFDTKPANHGFSHIAIKSGGHRP
jgi:uncharacterized protein YdaU (DUF1376 family)